MSQEYLYDKDQLVWGVSDRLVLGWQGVLGENDLALRRAGRLFFFHEYVHDYQTLTAATAKEVGKFGSVLEHIDYVADVYALLHELTFTLGTSAEDRAQAKAALDTLLETMLSAMWAFAPAPGSAEWEVRRLRRFLNWYWRQISWGESST